MCWATEQAPESPWVRPLVTWNQVRNQQQDVSGRTLNIEKLKSGTKILDKIHVRAEDISELTCFQVVFGKDSRDEPSRKDAIKYGVTSRRFTEDEGGEEHRRSRINIIK